MSKICVFYFKTTKTTLKPKIDLHFETHNKRWNGRHNECWDLFYDKVKFAAEKLKDFRNGYQDKSKSRRWLIYNWNNILISYK